MIINYDGDTDQNVSVITEDEKLLIYAYLQGAVYCWCKNRPDEWFSARKLVGGDNNQWQGTPAYPLFQYYLSIGKGGDYAVDEAGKALGKLLKRVILEDKRTFETREGYMTREYKWTGAEDNNHWPDWLPKRNNRRYKTVEEMCSDEGKVVYHFFAASKKEKILKEGLLCSKGRCNKAAEKKGIYVVWSDDTRVQSYIVESQVCVDENFNPVGDICRIKINLKKYGITANDIAPDLNGEKDCDPNSFCCKIIKDIVDIDPNDIEDWHGGNSDMYGVEFFNLEGYNEAHKPTDYDFMASQGLYPKRSWKKYA